MREMARKAGRENGKTTGDSRGALSARGVGMMAAMAVERETLMRAIEAAVLAPSSHNSQPWRFQLLPDGVDLFADQLRALPVVDPEGRELTISCGAALFHLRLALRQAGFVTEVSLVPGLRGGDHLARVRCVDRAEAAPYEEALFAAIRKRHTHRAAFAKRNVEGKQVGRLVDAAGAEGVGLRVLDAWQQNSVAGWIEEGDRLQGANAEFRRELSTWVHAKDAENGVGMSAAQLGVHGLGARLMPAFLRELNWGRVQGRRDHQLAMSAPVLAVLVSKGDTARDWLETGCALERMLLEATSMGLAASFLNQAVEVAELREKVRELLGGEGYPQIIVRLGYGVKTVRSARVEALVR
jgi:nitroreductase